MKESPTLETVEANKYSFWDIIGYIQLCKINLLKQRKTPGCIIISEDLWNVIKSMTIDVQMEIIKYDPLIEANSLDGLPVFFYDIKDIRICSK